MQFNLKKEIKNYLKSNGILDLDKDKKLVAVVKAVANIPWGDGRTIEEVLVTKKVGTCTGKHLVLGACLDELGIKYRHIVCTFRWGDQKIKYPKHLRNIFKEGEWEHGHNFIQIKKDNKYVDVDITWNPKLKEYGFTTFPEDWDGKSSFVGIDKIVRRWDGVGIESIKKKLIKSLSPKIQERRERFLKEFIEWIDSINM